MQARDHNIAVPMNEFRSHTKFWIANPIYTLVYTHVSVIDNPRQRMVEWWILIIT